MTKKFMEDVEEINKSLNYMSGELSKMVEKQDLVSPINEGLQLKTVIQEKDKKTEEVERRLDELEQYSRMDDLVVSGLVTPHCSYVRVTVETLRASTPCLNYTHLTNELLGFSAAETPP